MSKDDKVLEIQQIKAELLRRKPIDQMEQELKEARIQDRYQELQEKREERRLASQLDVFAPIDLQQVEAEILLRYANSQKQHVFLNKEIGDIVPIYGNNLIVVAGRSGQSKTTIALNLTHAALTEGKKVLLITTEALTSDLLTQLACLDLGYDPNQFKRLSAAALNRVLQRAGELSSRFYLQAPKTANGMQSTASLDWVESLFNQISTSPEERRPDYILFDYYQKIEGSSNMLQDKPWQILKRASKLFEANCNKLNIPIVIFVQLKEPSKTDQTFEQRIKEGTYIYQVATHVLEVIPDFDFYVTKFICRKARHGGLGQEFYVRYTDGRLTESLTSTEIEEYLVEKVKSDGLTKPQVPSKQRKIVRRIQELSKLKK